MKAFLCILVSVALAFGLPLRVAVAAAPPIEGDEGPAVSDPYDLLPVGVNAIYSGIEYDQGVNAAPNAPIQSASFEVVDDLGRVYIFYAVFDSAPYYWIEGNDSVLGFGTYLGGGI